MATKIFADEAGKKFKLVLLSNYVIQIWIANFSLDILKPVISRNKDWSIEHLPLVRRYGWFFELQATYWTEKGLSMMVLTRKTSFCVKN